MQATFHTVSRSAPLGLLLVCALLAACGSDRQDPDYVARIGDVVLMPVDLDDALAAMPAGMDAAMAREQYIEQWLTSQLLADEARRRGLLNDPDVQRQLQDNESNILAAALLHQLYDEFGSNVSRADLEAYFERHRNRMRLREPYVRVRHFQSASRDTAEHVRGELQAIARAQAEPGVQDSLFASLMAGVGGDQAASLALARSYVPQSRLARQAHGAPWSVVAQMQPGEVSDVLVTTDSTYFLVHLVERIPAGAEPELEWVADEVRQSIAIQNRKQMVAREVQRLRTEAEARGDLRIPRASDP